MDHLDEHQNPMKLLLNLDFALAPEQIVQYIKSNFIITPITIAFQLDKII